jgi:hypothetical protein
MNSQKLDALYRQMGAVGAENLMCRAMEALAWRLSQAERLYRVGARIDLRRVVRVIAVISGRVGMEKLSGVAADVVRCIDGADDIALAAVLARMSRLGERSLTEIREVRDFSV